MYKWTIYKHPDKYLLGYDREADTRISARMRAECLAVELLRHEKVEAQQIDGLQWVNDGGLDQRLEHPVTGETLAKVCLSNES